MFECVTHSIWLSTEDNKWRYWQKNSRVWYIVEFLEYFQDISKSTGSIFLGNNNKFNELYNKIFHASLNEQNDTSDLESEELELLKIIFEDGKQIIRKYIISF